MNTDKKPSYSEQLRKFAEEVRQNSTARDAIAQGFELLAEVLDPCTDCEECGECDECEAAQQATVEANGGPL